ncbi:MAG: efflux RND transporter periplasmic adaptor subunit [Helicobacteraceae bacterium]|jgi:HlyD family secretion protein|nr:efflux RND transporter periplasmic adaptor subunit [Helicobacteraceae bacterium]
MNQTIELDALHTKGGKKRKFILIGLALIALGAVAVWFAFFRNAETQPQYITAPIKRQDLRVTVQATGNLEPLRTVTVGIEVSGTLKEIMVDYNDPVKAGQPLARLDTVKLESSLNSSRAQLKVSQANLLSNEAAQREAKLQLNRLRQVFESTGGAYPSQKEMDSAQAAYDRANASLSASKAQLEQAKAEVLTGEENLRKAIAVSPIDGIVLTREVDVGQTVAASMQTPTLFTIAEDLKKMQVIVAVDEADVGEVKEGQQVSFRVNAYPNREFNGTVSQVRLGSQITSGVVTYNAVVLVDNSEGLLRPGMTAQAFIVTKQASNALVVPNAAFRFTPPVTRNANMFAASNRPSNARPVGERLQGDRIFLLENGVPRMARVKRGETDGALTVIEGENIAEGALAITSMRQAAQ